MLAIFSFNSFVYYLTSGFIASARAFNILTCAFNLLTCAFNLPTHAFNFATCAFILLTHRFQLITCGFEIVTHISELITHDLLFHFTTILVGILSLNKQLRAFVRDAGLKSSDGPPELSKNSPGGDSEVHLLNRHTLHLWKC